MAVWATEKSDSETARLDLPHMKARQPEAIKLYLEIRLKQLTLLGGILICPATL